MKDVFRALGLERAALIGNSLGGWMALKFATTYPENVSKLILIASSGIAQIRPQFLLNRRQPLPADNAVPVTLVDIGEQGMPKEVLEFINLIVENYNPIQDLPLYTDEQLQRLNMPVLFIDGEDDAIIDAESSAQRLLNLIPSANICLLPKCGHVVPDSIQYIMPFLVNARL
jgi:pimeloyl-ACP methyl ester carboxylesterase